MYQAIARLRFASFVAPSTGRENNFSAIRLFAALLVIYGHGQDMRGAATPLLWSRPVAQIGLDLFFCVSGYLIYDSWLRDPRLDRFLARRALRIMPGLTVCVVFCIAVVGVAATDLPLGTYIAHHGTWQFLLNAALYLKLHLPGVFAHRLLGGAVNGSLWSLLPEVLCYLAVPVICLAPRRLRSAFLLVVGGLCGGGALYMFAYHPNGYGLIYSADPKYVLAEVPFFMAGAFWRQVQLRVPGLLRLDVAVLMCTATFALPVALGQGSVPLRWLTLSYAVIAFGLAATPGLRDASRLGDLSYGAYLYAFPIQQLGLEYTDSILPPTLVTFGLAFLSWHLVEQPALRWKPSRPRQLHRPLVASSTGPDGWIDWLGLARRLTTQTPLLPGLTVAACLALFAARLGAGNWHEGEWVLFGALRAGDWATALPALAAYPVQGLLLAAYGFAVEAAGSAGLVSMLLAMWAGALGLAGVAAWKAHWGRPAVAVTLAAAPFAFVLATGTVIDSPATAVGILPAVAAMEGLWFLAGRPWGAWHGVMLAGAAGSSAAGAGLAVGMATALLLAARPGRRATVWVALIGLLAAVVLARTPLDHAEHGWAALAAHPGLLLLFALGFRALPWAVLPSVKGAAALPQRDAAVLGTGLVAATMAAAAANEAALASVALALTLALAIGVLMQAISARQAWWAPASLSLAFYPLLTWATSQVPLDTGLAVSARTRTWASARRTGEAMEFYLPPSETSLFGLPPGTYVNAPALKPVERVFGKFSITICNAWQLPESWLINGRFIPACPPHDGPPDRVATLP